MYVFLVRVYEGYALSCWFSRRALREFYFMLAAASSMCKRICLDMVCVWRAGRLDETLRNERSFVLYTNTPQAMPYIRFEYLNILTNQRDTVSEFTCI